jgi:hypothetical protein
MIRENMQMMTWFEIGKKTKNNIKSHYLQT